MSENTRIHDIPDSIKTIILSFVRPDSRYDSGEDLKPSGLDFPYGKTLLAQAIKERKARVPGTRVLLAVGGATYGAWRSLNAESIAKLVRAIGADGVDVDMELTNPACGSDGGTHISCTGGRLWRNSISELRAALPRPAIISVAGWSVAAYGEGDWRNAKPKSDHTGELLRLFRHRIAKEIDLVNVMAYNATADYDTVEAYKSYRAAWAGQLAVGILVPPDNGDQPDTTEDSVRYLCSALKDDPKAGVMVYAFAQPPENDAISANRIANICDEVLTQP